MKRKIKQLFLTITIYIFKYNLIFQYFFIKLFTKQNNDVFLLSRQFNEVSLNYKLIIDKLENENISYKVICKKVSSGLNSVIRNENKKANIFKELKGILSYYFSLYTQMTYCAKSKVIIVDGYNITSSMLKHKKNTKVIQLWHSLGAIKKFGYQTIGYKDGLNPKIAKILCMHKNYDYVVGGTKQMCKYFAKAFAVDEKKMLSIGSPVVDYLLTSSKDIEKLYAKYPQMKKKTNILYSPTFRSDGTDNVEEVIKKFKSKKCNLILTFHPKNQVHLEQENVICINRNEFSTFDVLKVCDYVITDYSALSIDAAILNKKVLLYVYDYEKYNEENGLNFNLFTELKNNVSKDITEIFDIIENNKYDMNSFNSFRKKYANFNKPDNTEQLVNIVKDNL